MKRVPTEEDRMTKLTNKPYWKASKEERQKRNTIVLWGFGIWIAAMLVLALVNEIRNPGAWADAQAKVEAEKQRKYPVNGLTAEQAARIIDDCQKNPDALRCQ